MDRHEFYDWQLRHSGARYFLGSRMRDDGDRSSMLALNFTPKHEHLSEREIETFAIVRNHVRNAWLLRSKREEKLSQLPAFLGERVPWGVITLDLHGRVLAINGQAEQIAAAKDGLHIERGQLVAWKSAENRSLQQLIGNVLKAAADPVEHKGGVLLIARRSGLPGYIVQVQRISAAVRTTEALRPRSSMFPIRCPASNPACLSYRLRSISRSARPNWRRSFCAAIRWLMQPRDLLCRATQRVITCRQSSARHESIANPV